MADWVMVGITAVYVIATIVICCANLKSAKATRDQLVEAKRQFDEENKAFVTVTFDVIKGGLMALCIENHGKQIAHNVQVNICEDFIKSLTSEKDREHIVELCNSTFTIGIGRKWYFCLGTHLELKRLSQVPLSIQIYYVDNCGKHEETVVIDLKQYLWSMIYNSPMDEAKDELKKVRETLQKIEKILSKE